MNTRNILYCLMAIFICIGLSCASDGSTGCGASVSPNEDKDEALLQKMCLASGCPDRVAQCFSERWKKISHGQPTSPIASCTWFMNTYSTEHPCYSACGSCSQGSGGYDRMYGSVKMIVGCGPF